MVNRQTCYIFLDQIFPVIAYWSKTLDGSEALEIGFHHSGLMKSCARIDYNGLEKGRKKI